MCNKLESAETTLLKTALKLRLKADKAALKSKNKSPIAPDTERDITLASSLVPRAKRPTHRLPLSFMPFALPFVGQVVDSIEWSRDEIKACNALLEKGRDMIGEEVRQGEDGDGISKTKMYPPLNSAFVTFHRQLAAHMAMQVLTHHDPYRMSGKYVEVSPEDVIWENLNMNPYEMKVRLFFPE
jgi:hypothetical protein